MNANDLLDVFTDTLWLEDGLSRNTLESYRRDLNKFHQWLTLSGSKQLPLATHADIQGFLAYLVGEQKARASRDRKSVV